jgi:hypothetical protein
MSRQASEVCESASAEDMCSRAPCLLHLAPPPLLLITRPDSFLGHKTSGSCSLVTAYPNEGTTTRIHLLDDALWEFC